MERLLHLISPRHPRFLALCLKSHLHGTPIRAFVSSSQGLLGPSQPKPQCSAVKLKHCHHALRNKYTNFNLLPFRCISNANSIDEISLKDIRLQKYLNDILERFIKAQTKLMAGKIKTDSERHEVNTTIKQLKPLVMPLQEYSGKGQEIEDLRQMADEMGKDDPEIQDAAASEILEIEKNMKDLEREVLYRLVPPDDTDNNDIILEVSAGVGGEEAFLFTAELFEMYESFAAYNGWTFNIITEDLQDGTGGLRKGSASVSGHGAYKTMKYEAGVHRVQRVPRTEKAGRVHTSTGTVAIMPQVDEIEVTLHPKDLKIDTYRSSGPGGQHVNTTDSAVRIKHVPTGVVAECQSDRSQIKNKASAMKILRSRIYQRQLEEQQAQERRTRKMQVGSAGRSEKVRTYNFKQDRITDHRLSQNAYHLDSFLAGGEPLLEMTQKLQREAWKERVLEIITDHEENVK